ncbi:ABC transporter ATP-binding protein [Variovorax boronicumulans]|uniref:ABC transporter ATP-binding protein n=1 Tax=Variovorax boronicumulans TaxID=436515 RepID=UPI001C5759FB
MSTHTTPLMAAKDIAHSFRGLSVLRGITFDVPEGAITGLIGPNGAGKSTLFNIVSGFLAPKGGTVRYDGQDITGWSVPKRARAGLIRTFQTPQTFANMTVEENLVAAGYLGTASSFLEDLFMLPRARGDLRRMRENADAVGERFNLQSVWGSRAGDLPAGRQRMVELARAAVAQPRLLCLDEPSSGLNMEEVTELAQALQTLKQGGTTLLLVSHDMDLMTVADTVHVLCFGEIITSGPLREVKQDPRVREAYLGV